MTDYFSELFADLYLPVVICKNEESLPVAYMNIRAALLFDPSNSVEQLKGTDTVKKLDDVLVFHSGEERSAFFMMAKTAGRIEKYASEARTFDANVFDVLVTGNTTTCGGRGDYLVLYIVEREELHNDDISVYDNMSTSVINTALLAPSVEESLDLVIGLAGTQMRVSRVYVFEEISETMTRNTYEWCAKGIEPAIQDLQNLEKADYNYDTIVGSGMYVTDDVRELPAEDREILEAQGIKSIAILTIYDGDKALGYVGFDDCSNYRKWSNHEMHYLKTVSSMVALLIMRRNAEQGVRRSIDALQIISDNSDEVVYVNDLSDYSVKFVSKALADSLGVPADELLGRKCWEVFATGQDGPCSYCPIPKVEMGGEVYVWERENPITKKTYIIKDSIIRWVDGSLAHAETAIDITDRKKYEDRLKYLASIDAMTGAYNREYGMTMMEERLRDPETSGVLCFFDVDGLKATNDRFGHDAGDGLLVQTVHLVDKYILEDEFICRWGGDEFLIWFERPEEEVAEIMQSIQYDMEERNKKGTEPYVLSFSYGIVPVQQGEYADVDRMVQKADALMYENKMEKRRKAGKRRRTDTVKQSNEE